jgi:nucleoside 2-deoxyribosyltransferase
MVNFLKKRLQIFVSSTYIDLREERQAAVEAILTAGHIPAGMELFTAGDESQMDVIKQWIDESDVYLLILGGRYGSIEPKSGKSYTHIEYDYAVSQNKPLFACVIQQGAIEERVKNGIKYIEQENPQKLKEFVSLVSTKMLRFWSDTKDIKLTILETLSHFSRKEDLIGWIRPTEQVDAPALADE